MQDIPPEKWRILRRITISLLILPLIYIGACGGGEKEPTAPSGLDTAEGLSLAAGEATVVAMSAATLASLGSETTQFFQTEPGTAQLVTPQAIIGDTCGEIDQTLECPAGGTVTVTGTCTEDPECEFFLELTFSFTDCQVPVVVDGAETIFTINGAAEADVSVTGCDPSDLSLELIVTGDGLTVSDPEGSEVDIASIAALVTLSGDSANTVFRIDTRIGSILCLGLETPSAESEEIVGECCTDTDGDEVCNADDNCPDQPNQGQTDTDGDGIGDACQTDPVCGDGVCSAGESNATCALDCPPLDCNTLPPCVNQSDCDLFETQCSTPPLICNEGQCEEVAVDCCGDGICDVAAGEDHINCPDWEGGDCSCGDGPFGAGQCSGPAGAPCTRKDGGPGVCNVESCSCDEIGICGNGVLDNGEECDGVRQRGCGANRLCSGCTCNDIQSVPDPNELVCNDGLDIDHDGKYDCNDEDCASDPFCDCSP